MPLVLSQSAKQMVWAAPPPCRTEEEPEPLEGHPCPGFSGARALLQVVTAQFALSHSDWMLACSPLNGTRWPAH